MMKKILFSALAMGIAAASAWARPLSPQQALDRAMGEAAGSGMRAPATSALTLTRSIAAPGSQTPALYLFAADRTMMIVSADDATDALLGYCDEAAGELPSQMQAWLEGYAAQIEYAAAHPAKGLLLDSPAATSSRADREPITPMISTIWNQSAPFNNLCPMVGGKRAVTGCVATAGAQVLKYFDYPQRGTGTVSYNDNGTNRTLNLSGKDFDWANMIDNYNNSYTATQASAVAYLMQACGYVSSMNYTATASGTQSEYFLSGAKKYLGINSAATFLNRDYYGIAQWESLIYENLKNVGPVYYDGVTDESEGHAFVCDGYSSDGYFHFNWGWGGSYDGYFRLTALNPEGQGIGGAASGGGFNFSQGVILNLTTPTGTTMELPQQAPMTLLGSLTATKSGANGVVLSSDAAQYYNVFCYNSSESMVTVDLGLKMQNLATNDVKYTTLLSSYQIGVNSGFSSLNGNLTGLSQGDYKVSFVCRNAGAGEWIPLNHALSDVDYFMATINASGSIASLTNAEPAELTVENLELLTDVYWGRALKFKYKVTNEGDTEVFDGYYPALFTINNDGSASLLAYANSKIFDLLGGESEDVEIAVNMTIGQSSFSGSAYFGLVSVMSGYIVDFVPVTIEAASAPNPQSTKFSFVGNSYAADASNLQFECGIKNTSGYYAAPLVVWITPENGGYVLQTFSSSDYYFLSAGQTASATFGGAMPSAQLGESYAAFLMNPMSSSQDTLDYLTFTVSQEYSGIEVANGEKAGVKVVCDRSSAMAMVVAPTEISGMEFYTIDGRRAAVQPEINGASASASLAQLPAGLVIVKVTLADGTVHTAKIVK